MRGTLRDFEVTVDGLPMAVEALPGDAAPGADLGGIERILRFSVPFAAEEKRGIRLVYRIGDPAPTAASRSVLLPESRIAVGWREPEVHRARRTRARCRRTTW